MAFKFYNPNPKKKLTDDCVIRAISKFLDQPWDITYIELFKFAYAQNERERQAIIDTINIIKNKG